MKHGRKKRVGGGYDKEEWPLKITTVVEQIVVPHIVRDNRFVRQPVVYCNWSGHLKTQGKQEMRRGVGAVVYKKHLRILSRWKPRCVVFCS